MCSDKPVLIRSASYLREKQRDVCVRVLKEASTTTHVGNDRVLLSLAQQQLTMNDGIGGLSG